MFLGASFSLVYYPTSPDASFTQEFKDSGWIPVTGSSYNFGTETSIKVISMQCRRKRKWWVGRAWNLCRSCWDHVDIVFRHNAITTSGIRPPYVNEAYKSAQEFYCMFYCSCANPLTHSLPISQQRPWTFTRHSSGYIGLCSKIATRLCKLAIKSSIIGNELDSRFERRLSCLFRLD